METKKAALKRDQVLALLTAAKRHSKRAHAMCLLAIRHGLRCSEVTGLRLAQVNLKEEWIRVERLKGSMTTQQPLERHPGQPLLDEVHNLPSLQSAHDRLVKGCYGDALVLLRVPYEAFLRMVFMSLFPADAMSALSDPERGSGRLVFNATNLVTQNLRLKWDDYKVLSVFAHAHRYAALSHAIDIRHRGRRDPIRLEYRFDDGQFTMGANLLTIVLYMFLGMVVQVFGRDVAAPPRLVERIKKASEVADVVGAILRTHRRQYLPTVAKDIEDVLQLVRAADDGEPWERAWRRIRRR